MLDYVEKYAAFYANYQKFKSQVEIHQLMPEKAVMNELKELRRAHRAYLQWKEDREASKRDLVANALSDQQKDALSQEQKDEFEKEKESQLHEIDAEIDTQKQLDNQNQVRIK